MIAVVSDGTAGPAEFHYNLDPADYGVNFWSHHAWFAVTAGLVAYVGDTPYPLVNAGPENCCTMPSNGFAYTGTAVLSVEAGDTYGFQVSGIP